MCLLLFFYCYLHHCYILSMEINIDWPSAVVVLSIRNTRVTPLIAIYLRQSLIINQAKRWIIGVSMVLLLLLLLRLPITCWRRIACVFNQDLLPLIPSPRFRAPTYQSILGDDMRGRQSRNRRRGWQADTGGIITTYDTYVFCTDGGGLKVKVLDGCFLKGLPP